MASRIAVLTNLLGGVPAWNCKSGNHEMQKYNTGVAGYKLEGVGSITERIGDIASQGLFLGGSKIVNS